MADEKKHTVQEKIEVLMASAGEAVYVDHKEFIAKVEELYAKNAYRSFVSFSIELIKDEKAGWGLLFVGDREETKEETAKREAMEAAKRKSVEDAELKQYIQLKKKYGKKDEQT
jgi:hypothetical protein